MTEPAEIGSGKGRKRAGTKPATRQVAAKVKATVHISLEASQRLTVHAAMMGMDRSALIEYLITTHLKRYVVSDRGRDGTAGEDAAA